MDDLGEQLGHVSLGHISHRRMVRERTQDDSDDELFASTYTDLPWKLKKDGFTQEENRAGSPPLQLLPLQSRQVDPSSPECSAFSDILPSIEDFLRTQITFDVHFVHRLIPYEVFPRSGSLTVLVVTESPYVPKTWLRAVGIIRSYLAQIQLLANVKVEIISRSLEEPRQIYIIEPDHPLVGLWIGLNSQIHEVLNAHEPLNLGWRSIDCIKIGSARLTEPRPVISLTVDWTLHSKDWLPAQRKIENLLKEKGISDQVSVQFERGDVCAVIEFPLRSPNPASTIEGQDIIQGAYSDKVLVGSDIGPVRYFSRMPSDTEIDGPVATFGGYIVVDVEGEQSRKMGLTNYHAIREAIEGFVFEDDPKHPSLGKRGAPITNSMFESESWPFRLLSIALMTYQKSTTLGWAQNATKDPKCFLNHLQGASITVL